MSEEEYKIISARLKEHTEKALKSKEAALAVLVAAGIATPSGELSPQYK